MEASSHLLFPNKGSTVCGPHVQRLHPVATQLRKTKLARTLGCPSVLSAADGGKQSATFSMPDLSNSA